MPFQNDLQNRYSKFKLFLQNINVQNNGVNAYVGAYSSILSLGALESKGFVVIIQDGVLNLISGALLVMRDTRRNNLYYYNGSTVIGIVTTISGSDEDLEITSLDV